MYTPLQPKQEIIAQHSANRMIQVHISSDNVDEEEIKNILSYYGQVSEDWYGLSVIVKINFDIQEVIDHINDTQLS